MKVKRFDFNFKPLQISVGMLTDGSVSGRQSYDADADVFTPDYTLTPCIIQPQVGRLDKDEVLTPGLINSSLTNIRWYETIGGTRTQIQTDNTNYEMTTSGVNAGRIKVKKNASPKNPITLEFNADYVDSRTSQVYHIQQTYQVFCDDATTLPYLFLDAADQTIYNPLKDPDIQVVHASLRIDKNECPTANRAFIWEKMREDGTWSQVGTDTVLDYELTVSQDGTSCTVDRSLMGTDLYLRCRAKYSPNGDLTGQTLHDSSPAKTVAFIRRLPKFEFDMAGVPTNIPSGLVSISPEAKIWDVNGAIANPEKELLPLWYVATNRASGTLTYNQVGHGMNPVLPTSAMSNTLGAVYALDVVDCGFNGVMEDDDDVLFEDYDGALLIFK